jgi:hypothetical protein
MTIRYGNWFCSLLAALLLLAVGCNNDGVMDSGMDSDMVALVNTQTEKSTYSIGETLVVDVVIIDALNVASVPFHLLYNKDVLQFVAPVVQGPFMGSDGTPTVLFADDIGEDGDIVIGLTRLGSEQGASGAGTLLTLRFEALNAGACEFDFTEATLKDPQAMILPATFTAHNVQVIP